MHVETPHVREPEQDQEVLRVDPFVDRGAGAAVLTKPVERQRGGYGWHNLAVKIDKVEHGVAGDRGDEMQDLEAREEMQQQHNLGTLRCKRKVQPDARSCGCEDGYPLARDICGRFYW